MISESVRTQYVISNLAHGVRLDVVAEGKNRQIYNLEIQRKDTKDHARRSRFYGSLLDSETLDKGAAYDELADIHILYISETDIWQAGKMQYSVEKKLKEVESDYDDGMHVLYVNAEVNDGSSLAKLMQYFKTADPDDMSQGALSKRVHFLKCEEGGEEEMCEISDRIYQAGVLYGQQEGIRAVIDTCRDLAVTRENTLKQLIERFCLQKESAAQYIDRYW